MNDHTVSTTTPTADERLVQELSTDLYKAKGWMKLLGVLSIIQGIMLVFSLWGILICWLPIWMGVLLMVVGLVTVVAIGGLGALAAMAEG